jgi:hypothetical protein
MENQVIKGTEVYTLSYRIDVSSYNSKAFKSFKEVTRSWADEGIQALFQHFQEVFKDTQRKNHVVN